MKKTKRLLSLILIAALCLGLAGVLAGCNKKEKTDDPASPGAEEPTGVSPTPGEETYVYVPTYVSLQEKLENGVNTLAFRDGRFLASSYMKVRSEIPEGVTPQWEGQYDVYENRFFWVGLDGSIEWFSGYQPAVESGNNQGSSISSIRFTEDGKLLALEETYRSWYDGPDDVEMYSDEWYQKEYYNYQHWENTFFLRLLDTDGSELSRLDLSELQHQMEEEGSYFYPNNVLPLKDGRILMMCDSGLLVLNMEGTLEKKIDFENYVENILQLQDGRIAVAYYGENGEVVSILDQETLELNTDETYPVMNVWNATPGGGDYDFYYTNGSNFMGCKLGSDRPEKVLNWINVDVDPSGLGNCFVTEDGRVVTIQTLWDEDEDDEGTVGTMPTAVGGADVSQGPTTQILILSKVPASSVAQKKVLTLATMYLDYNMRRMIVKFNRSNPDYRIELLDYSEYNTSEDYSAGQTKLNTEIMAGNVPDILNLSGLSWDKMAARGVLTDLMPYLESDEELHGQLFDNILRALQSDGKLYRTVSSFQIQTVMGASSVVGDTPGWTLEEFNAALKTMPAGCEPFGVGMTRDQILTWGLSMELNQLVDWSSGKCSFDSPRFTDILKLANEFPKEFNWEEYQWTMEDDEPQRIASGRQMLMQVWISDFESVQMYDAIFGGSATYIGFPTNEGVGNVIQFGDEGYAISSKCRDKDAAWQFLRTLFTEKYQSQNVWSLPTNRNAFNKKLEEAMTPQYMTDEKGNFILDEDGNKIEVDRGSWGWGSIEVKIGALTQAQADKILELIETTDRCSSNNEEVMEMIQADCEAYFSGQKTAEEVGRLLQSKMTIYINEQR